MVSLGVVLGVRLMNRPIHFYDEASLITIEVHDKAVNNLLAAKVQPCHPMAAKVLPQNPFFLGHRLAKLPGPRHLLGRHSLLLDNTT